MRDGDLQPKNLKILTFLVLPCFKPTLRDGDIFLAMFYWLQFFFILKAH